MHPTVPSVPSAMCYLVKEKAEAPALITIKPLMALGCILTMQDPEQLQALSSCLTNSPLHYGLLAENLTSAFPIESSLLMQKMKQLRGLLNISELFNHNFPP